MLPIVVKERDNSHPLNSFKGQLKVSLISPHSAVIVSFASWIYNETIQPFS
ncbi:hypothetical protein MFUM_830012 [Methylacidiphilum fumariolicum SolV]|uniref:Uncharacterized protein n=1 Tax=Methylacidiphilum fumariolicum (strain SolV) TaxID=1156937 RepID=I0K087_METFB|nr:hypothetical protein [Candidatus Methylacidiphilum fumarolicum]CCG92906.1 hypothetical protein MFUM_830012 [Methylacidiphilum fumariolicum SolV]